MNDRHSMDVRYAAQRDIAERLAPDPDPEARECPMSGEPCDWPIPESVCRPICEREEIEQAQP